MMTLKIKFKITHIFVLEAIKYIRELKETGCLVIHLNLVQSVRSLIRRANTVSLADVGPPALLDSFTTASE